MCARTLCTRVFTGLLNSCSGCIFCFDENKCRKVSRACGAPTLRPGTCPRLEGSGVCVSVPFPAPSQARLPFSSNLRGLWLGREGPRLLWPEIKKVGPGGGEKSSGCKGCQKPRAWASQGSVRTLGRRDWLLFLILFQTSPLPPPQRAALLASDLWLLSPRLPQFSPFSYLGWVTAALLCPSLPSKPSFWPL